MKSANCEASRYVSFFFKLCQLGLQIVQRSKGKHLCRATFSVHWTQLVCNFKRDYSIIWIIISVFYEKIWPIVLSLCAECLEDCICVSELSISGLVHNDYWYFICSDHVTDIIPGSHQSAPCDVWIMDKDCRSTSVQHHRVQISHDSAKAKVSSVLLWNIQVDGRIALK